METTRMTVYTVVLFDGEMAYTEKFIAELSKDGHKKVMDYCKTYGMEILLCQPKCYTLDKNELTKELKDECIRDRYFSMYCC